MYKGCAESESMNTGWLKECGLLILRNSNWRVSLARREVNACADFLATKALREKWFWNNKSAIPRCLPVQN